MPTIIKPDREASVDGKDLASELHLLMMSSITYRGNCGATFDIQGAYLRMGKNIDWPNSLPGYQVKPTPPAHDKPCNCKDGEHCDLCDESLDDICSTEDVMEAMENTSPFKRVARLISTIKAYDYTSLVEHAYAKTGNKPFKLKSNKEITINEGVRSVGEWAFTDCACTEMTIPNTVTNIGNNVFNGCTNLASITMSENLTNIGDHAFDGCNILTGVVIGNVVTNIGVAGFANCSGLTGNITIPGSVTSIGENAFSNCSSLTSMTFTGRTLEQVKNIEDGSGNKHYPWGLDESKIVPGM